MLIVELYDTAPPHAAAALAGYIVGGYDSTTPRTIHERLLFIGVVALFPHADGVLGPVFVFCC